MIGQRAVVPSASGAPRSCRSSVLTQTDPAAKEENVSQQASATLRDTRARFKPPNRARGKCLPPGAHPADEVPLLEVVYKVAAAAVFALLLVLVAGRQRLCLNDGVHVLPLPEWSLWL